MSPATDVRGPGSGSAAPEAAAAARPIPTDAFAGRARGLRVTHVLRRLSRAAWGGTETVVTELTAALQERGVACEIACTRALGGPRYETLRGVPVRRFGHVYPYLLQTRVGRRKLDDKGGNPVSPGLQLHLLRTAADLYHAHAVGRIGAAVRNAARLRRRPYVVSLHGGHTEIPASQLRELLRAPGMRLPVGKLVYPLLPQRRVIADAAEVLCVGLSEAEAVARLHPQARVTYLPNAVDARRFASGDGDRFRRATGATGQPLLLCVGRIDAQKSQHVLVRALAGLREHLPGAELVLLGSVSDGTYLERLRGEIEDLRLSSAVRLLPGLPPDDPLLVDAYAAADVVVLPSIHEPFGIVVLEAWAAGKPVVASRVGGLEALVEDGRTGRLVPPGDERALREALETLLASPATAMHLASRGRREAVERYSWDAHARQTLEVYERALGRDRWW